MDAKLAHVNVVGGVDQVERKCWERSDPATRDENASSEAIDRLDKISHYGGKAAGFGRRAPINVTAPKADNELAVGTNILASRSQQRPNTIQLAHFGAGQT